MRRRPSSRLLILEPNGCVLLFHFVFCRGALAGQQYWATPGGALEAGENFEDAARRELFEETGMAAEALSEPVAEREFLLQLPDGEQVIAEERFFVIRAASRALSREHWSRLETEVMANHRWWSVGELKTANEIVFPDNLVGMLEGLGPGDGARVQQPC